MTRRTTLKPFTLGPDGRPGRRITAALGLDPHEQVCDVFAVAETKRDAHTLLDQARIFIAFSNAGFRQARGGRLQVMRAAGLFDQPGVYAVPRTGAGRVVRVLPGGEPEPVGHLTGSFARWKFTPVTAR